MKTVLSSLPIVLLALSAARAAGQADAPDRQVVFRSGELGCLYEADNCATITFAKFPLTWLTAESATD